MRPSTQPILSVERKGKNFLATLACGHTKLLSPLSKQNHAYCRDCVKTPEEFRSRFPDWEYLSFEYGRWSTTHRNYDAEYCGEEDGWVDNGLKAEGRTLQKLADKCVEKELEL